MVTGIKGTCLQVHKEFLHLHIRCFFTGTCTQIRKAYGHRHKRHKFTGTKGKCSQVYKAYAHRYKLYKAYVRTSISCVFSQVNKVYLLIYIRGIFTGHIIISYLLCQTAVWEYKMVVTVVAVKEQFFGVSVPWSWCWLLLPGVDIKRC